ncbi:MAG: hypothetical protein JNM49_03895 [Flavobacteriales bacterium]|jgi:hypothetical protein|nr:hypothetical protein [Flavobacteriales bacterium]
MNNDALILMLGSVLIVTGITVYFFYRVLTSPPKKEPDSYAENDDVKR